MTEPRCGVCQHPDPPVIDGRIHSGEPNTRTARTFGLSRWQVDRHAKLHLAPAVMLDAGETVQVRELRDLDGRLVALENLLSQVLDQALRGGKVTNIVQVSREVRLTVADIARLRGELADARPVQVNVLQAREFRLVLARLLESLQEFPEARYRAAAALSAMEEE